MAIGSGKMKPKLKDKQMCSVCDAKFDGLKLKDDEILVVEIDTKSYKEMNVVAKQLAKFAQQIGRPIFITKPGIDVSSVSIDELIKMKTELDNK